MSLWDRIKKNFTKQPKLLGDGSKPAIEKGGESRKDLSPEHFKIMFANELGIDAETLNLPGVKKYIFSLSMFDGITDKKSYKEAVKRIGKNIEVSNIENDNSGLAGIDIKDQDIVNGARIEKDGVRIEKLTGLTKIFFVNRKKYEEECRCFNSKGLEVKRFHKTIGDKKYSKMFERDNNNIQIVTFVNSDISSNKYNIAWNEADIATLDDVENGEIIKINSLGVSTPIMSIHSKQDNDKKIAEKIKNSERADIFYEHYRYDTQDNSKSQDSSKLQDNSKSPDTQPIIQQRNEYRETFKKIAENITPEQYKMKFAQEMGIDFTTLNLPGVKDFIFTAELFSGIKDKDSYEKAKSYNTKVIGENGEINLEGIGIKSYEKIVIKSDGEKGKIITKATRDRFGMNNKKIEERRYNQYGLEIERKIEEKFPRKDIVMYLKRDEQDISIVHCKAREKIHYKIKEELEHNGIYDISSGGHDIATLNGFKIDSSKDFGRLIGTEHDGKINYTAEKNPDSIKQKKIKESQRSDIFYQHYGFDNPDVSDGIEK